MSYPKLSCCYFATYSLVSNSALLSPWTLCTWSHLSVLLSFHLSLYKDLVSLHWHFSHKNDPNHPCYVSLSLLNTQLNSQDFHKPFSLQWCINISIQQPTVLTLTCRGIWTFCLIGGIRKQRGYVTQPLDLRCSGWSVDQNTWHLVTAWHKTNPLNLGDFIFLLSHTEIKNGDWLPDLATGWIAE